MPGCVPAQPFGLGERKPVLMRSLLLRLALFVACVGGVGLSLGFAGGNAAHAQAQLTFAGGNGGPITLTLLNSLTYTVFAVPSAQLYFDFDGVGGPIVSGTGSGTITYSVNGGAPQVIDSLTNGFAAGSVTPDDLALRGLFIALGVGDTVTLTPGTFTTAFGFNGTFTNGTYATRLSDFGGNFVGTVVSAPEPTSVAFALPLLTGMAVCVRRRK